MTREYRRDLLTRREIIRQEIAKVRLHPIEQRRATVALARIDAELAPRRINR